MGRLTGGPATEVVVPDRIASVTEASTAAVDRAHSEAQVQRPEAAHPAIVDSQVPAGAPVGAEGHLGAGVEGRAADAAGRKGDRQLCGEN